MEGGTSLLIIGQFPNLSRVVRILITLMFPLFIGMPFEIGQATMAGVLWLLQNPHIKISKVLPVFDLFEIMGNNFAAAPGHMPKNKPRATA